MYTIRATKKVLDRVRPVLVDDPPTPTTAFGDWYVNVLFWKPQAALFVNERTFLAVLVPFAPAAGLAERFPPALAERLRHYGAHEAFVEAELAAMSEHGYAKTASRSVLGVMNQYVRSLSYAPRDDLVGLGLWLSDTPITPLERTWPMDAAQAIHDDWLRKHTL